MDFDISILKFDEHTGLLPAIIQDEITSKVLMLGYVNEESLKITLDSKRVTFYSRSRAQLWTKGESSGHYLNLKSITKDCDSDTLLIKVIPVGPTCHEGYDTCFREVNSLSPTNFIRELESIIADRKANPKEGSYTTSLFQSGITKIAQKVGEEAVETILEAQLNNDKALLYETSDMIYHLLVLLQAKNLSWDQVVSELVKKHKK